MRILGDSAIVKIDPERALDPIALATEYTQEDAESEVRGKMRDEMDQDQEERVKKNVQKAGGSTNGTLHSNGSGDNAFGFALPTATSSSCSTVDSSTASSGTSTPLRRRAAAPASIPNFPLANAPRDPPPFFTSPSTSPPAHSSPQSSPPSRPTPSMRLPVQPFSLSTQSPALSPWHALAATSGAPTPSLEGGPTPGVGRSSPHLGYPFEQLNLGGSWSGANLWGEGSQDRRGSVPEAIMEESPSSSPRQASSVPSAENLARYRAMAGRASNSGARVRGPVGREEPSTSISTSPQNRPPLPPALARRRGSLPKNILEGALSPPMVVGSKAPSPLAVAEPTPSPIAGLQPLSTPRLKRLLQQSTTLVLDLRPPSMFAAAHLPSSISLSIPSTLLKRPAFNLQKLSQMLGKLSGDVIAKWQEMSDIILVDADSTSPQQNALLEGVASKFEREDFRGQVWFVKGGHSAISATPGIKLFEDGGQPGTQGVGSQMVGKLDKLAFQHGSVGSQLQGELRSPSVQTTSTSIQDPFANISTSSPTRPSLSLKTQDRRSAQSVLSLASSGRASSSGFQSAPKLQPANPFFDNIRQNLELSHGGGHEKISLGLPEKLAERADDLPPWLAELAAMDDAKSAERLADEFYRVELGEQKRLQSVMDWHSQSSGGAIVELANAREKENKEAANFKDWCEGDVSTDYFPFSITAGVERGTKNRYKNIWPYDFSRVRLDSPPESDCDYINASFVQPRGTSRRYIATQGPLDATYEDFWTLIWEQQVRVIVMLTKQYEGGQLKCGNYWNAGQYGRYKLELLSHTGGDDLANPAEVTGFDFGTTPKAVESGNIHRAFRLTRDDQRDEPPRHVAQVQCVTWPDFDVPETPSVLLDLMRDVDTADSEVHSGPSEDRADQPPVLVHCSAGVGRTGSFIITDAIIDALRTERQTRHTSASTTQTNNAANLQTLHHTHLVPLPTPPTPLHRVQLPIDESSRAADQNPSDSGSPLGSAAGSGDWNKSVSFLSPPTEVTASGSPSGPPSRFTKSPSPLVTQTSPPRTSSPSTIGNADQPTQNVVIGLEDQAESMDVDPKPPLPKQLHPQVGEMFTRHRGASVNSFDSGESEFPPRRPSLATNTSGPPSSERIPQTGSLHQGLNAPLPVTRSCDRHRTPSPVAAWDGLSPVAIVLEGMRTQRMSLVQSLRQYLFVHRAIIQGYIDMVDEERSGVLTKHHSTDSRNSRSGSADYKRRASPTELVPELPVHNSYHGSGLAKRPSFKKMRPGNIDAISAKGKDRTSQGQ